MIGDDIQWGRYAEVTFTNFNTGVVTSIKSSQIDNNNNVIGDGLRITFEYTKNDDEGNNSPNGKIVIYGLTEMTFKNLGERMKAEVELKAGYLRSKRNSPRQLFYAVLMDKTYELQGGTSVTTITVLGDFINKNVGTQMSMNLPKPTMAMIMASIAEAMGKGMALYLNSPNENDNLMVAEYFEKWVVSPYGYSFSSTPQQELKRLRDAYGITYRVEKDMVVYGILDKAYQWHLDGARQISENERRIAETALVAENKIAQQVVEPKPIPQKEVKIDLLSTHALVLSSATGLIGSPVLVNKIEDKNYSEGLAEGEEVWEKKYSKPLIDKKTGKARVDKKTGKVKMSKTPKKYKVSRQTVEARCFINASLNFDCQVSIVTPSGITDGVYRIRNLKISGDTDASGPWYMDTELNGEGYSSKDLQNLGKSNG